MFQLSDELPPHDRRDHCELARVDPDVDRHAPHLFVPGEIGQPVVDIVDGQARDTDVLPFIPREHQVRLDVTNHRYNAWGS